MKALPLRRPPSRPSHRPTAVATLCALLAAPALAQEAASSLALETVVVSATRSDTRLQDMPLHTTVISQEEIRHSPAQTLDQLLRNVPALLVSGSPAYTTDPTGHNIKFRGMDKKVLVLVDGIPVLDPFYTTIQWFKVPLSSIERVEIVRGGGSSLWGNLAVGGVINIVSKRPKGDELDLAARLGSQGTFSSAASKSWRLSDAWAVNLSVDGFSSDGYNNSPEALRAAYWPGRGESSATAKNARLGVFFKPAAGLEGFARIGYHEQNEDIGGYAYGTNLQKSPDLQAGLTRTFDDRSRVAANLYAQNVRFDKYNGAGCYAASTFACGAPVSGAGATQAQRTAATLQYATSHDINTYRERGGSLVYSRHFDGLLNELQVGLDLRKISGEDAQQSYRTPTAALPAVLRVQRANYGGGAQSFAGLFSQFKLSPVEPLEVTFSARVDRFSSADGIALQTNYSNVAVPVAAATTGGPVPSLTKTAFDPSLSLRYELSDTLALRAAAYKAFRAPGLNNMFRSFGSSSITIANPLLEPETLVGKEVGVDWKWRNVSVGATVFQADVTNVVATYAITTSTPIPAPVQNICGTGYTGVANAACPGTVSFYTNGQDQRASGIELDGKWAVTDDLGLAAYATLTRTVYTRTTTGDPTGVQLPLMPKGVAGANVSWKAGRGWTWTADLRYNSPMTLSSLTLSPPVRQGGYTVVNVGASYRVNEVLEFTGAVTNLGDKRYTDGSASNPQGISLAMPRAYSVGLRAHF